jgi:molybdopterin-guanine dinucleotide biosynthesis protein A
MTDPGGTSILGVVLAGGRSQRFGADKAFADLDGLSLVERTARILATVSDRVGVVANDEAGHASHGLPVRPDLLPGIGPLGGLHTAVSWAAEEGLRGAIVLATDMPFVPGGLLRLLARRLAVGAAVVPASRGPRGLEPLCAAYGTGCLPAIEAAIKRRERAVISFFGDVDLSVVDLADVSSCGDPDVIFFNINRPEDRLRARELLSGMQAADAVRDAKAGHSAEG